MILFSKYFYAGDKAETKGESSGMLLGGSASYVSQLRSAILLSAFYTSVKGLLFVIHHIAWMAVASTRYFTESSLILCIVDLVRHVW